MGLCGDAFWDDLTAHSEVRQTYLNQARPTSCATASARRSACCSTATSRSSTTAARTTTARWRRHDKCKFFPVNAPGVSSARIRRRSSAVRQHARPGRLRDDRRWTTTARRGCAPRCTATRCPSARARACCSAPSAPERACGARALRRIEASLADTHRSTRQRGGDGGLSCGEGGARVSPSSSMRPTSARSRSTASGLRPRRWTPTSRIEIVQGLRAEIRGKQYACASWSPTARAGRCCAAPGGTADGPHAAAGPRRNRRVHCRPRTRALANASFSIASTTSTPRSCRPSWSTRIARRREPSSRARRLSDVQKRTLAVTVRCVLPLTTDTAAVRASSGSKSKRRCARAAPDCHPRSVQRLRDHRSRWSNPPEGDRTYAQRVQDWTFTYSPAAALPTPRLDSRKTIMEFKSGVTYRSTSKARSPPPRRSPPSRRPPGVSHSTAHGYNNGDLAAADVIVGDEGAHLVARVDNKTTDSR
jgi:hypothetical protein